MWFVVCGCDVSALVLPAWQSSLGWGVPRCRWKWVPPSVEIRSSDSRCITKKKACPSAIRTPPSLRAACVRFGCGQGHPRHLEPCGLTAAVKWAREAQGTRQRFPEEQLAHHRGAACLTSQHRTRPTRAPPRIASPAPASTAWRRSSRWDGSRGCRRPRTWPCFYRHPDERQTFFGGFALHQLHRGYIQCLMAAIRRSSRLGKLDQLRRDSQRFTTFDLFIGRRPHRGRTSPTILAIPALIRVTPPGKLQLQLHRGSRSTMFNNLSSSGLERDRMTAFERILVRDRPTVDGFIEQ